MVKTKKVKSTKKVSKKNSIKDNILVFIGFLSLGLFILALSTLVWELIAENAIIILTVSGLIVILFLTLGILSKKKVKNTLKGFFSNYYA